jgi:hypothetical protein
MASYQQYRSRQLIGCTNNPCPQLSQIPLLMGGLLLVISSAFEPRHVSSCYACAPVTAPGPTWGRVTAARQRSRPPTDCSREWPTAHSITARRHRSARLSCSQARQSPSRGRYWQPTAVIKLNGSASASLIISRMIWQPNGGPLGPPSPRARGKHG